MLKLWDRIKKLFHRPSSDQLSAEEIRDVAIAEEEISTGKSKTFETAKDLIADLHRGRKAARQDVGRFMKHGHQAPWYRKSVKAKIKPEDDEDEFYFDEQENPAD